MTKENLDVSYGQHVKVNRTRRGVYSYPICTEEFIEISSVSFEKDISRSNIYRIQNTWYNRDE